jgi:hypothetical protein
MILLKFQPLMPDVLERYATLLLKEPGGYRSFNGIVNWFNFDDHSIDNVRLLENHEKLTNNVSVSN